MPTVWFRRSTLILVAFLSGLLMTLSGCHLHHYGLHGFYRGGYHGGDHYHRGYHRHRHHRGYRRGGWRGRY